MGDKEEGGSSLFPHQIVDFHLHLHLHLQSLYLAALSHHHPLHYTVALDSGSDARYVRRQGRGLGI